MEMGKVESKENVESFSKDKTSQRLVIDIRYVNLHFNRPVDREMLYTIIFT